MRDVLRAVRWLTGHAWRASSLKSAAATVLVLSGALATPLLAVSVGRMTDDLLAGRASAAAVAGAIVGLLAIVSLTFGHLAHVFYFELSELAEIDFDLRLARLSNGSTGIGHHSRPELADMFTVLQRESRQFHTGLGAVLSTAGLMLAMTFTGVLLARVDPLLLLLPIAVLPPLVAGRLAERALDRARMDSAEPTRIALNLLHLTTSARHGGELRVGALDRELRERHARLWGATTSRLWRGQLAAATIRAAGQVTFAIAYSTAVLEAIRQAIAGFATVGSVVLVVVLAVQVNQQVTTGVRLLQDLQRIATAYRHLTELAASVDEPSLAGDAAPPGRLEGGITLDQVTFRYAGSTRPVLAEVCLTLPAGSTVAIVGENGAGKSTLVKLLCGLYQPTHGRILLDGADFRQLRPQQWWQRVSVGFQDFVRYELAVRQAVGLGDVEKIADDSAVLAALERAGGTEIVSRLPHGLDTELGNSGADGVELSGGQWQRLALGRAFMRVAPLLLILDEPAAALDPAAEDALFEQYAAQARRIGRSAGAITVFVSHRYSTVRTADLIVVLSDGRVAETGNHASLMAADGIYAGLYAAQSRSYR